MALPLWGLVLVIVAVLLAAAFAPSREIVWRDPLPGPPPRLLAGSQVELPVETPYRNLYGVDVRWQGAAASGVVRIGVRLGSELLLDTQVALGEPGEPLRLRLDPVARPDGLSVVLDGRDLPSGSELFIMGDAGGHAPLTFYHRLNGLGLAWAYLVAATQGKPLWWASPAALLALLAITGLVLLWFIAETIVGSDNL